MYPNYKTIFLFIFLVINSIRIYGIEPIWNIDLGGVFDNREGKNTYVRDRTYFIMTLAPEVGLKFSDSDRIATGVVWDQPVENSIKGGHIYPTLYYRHSGDKIKFSMGLFPMTQLREPLPGFLWNDSLSYFQRNLRGALFQYQTDKGFIDTYLDWRGIQSKTKREAFEIVFHGEFNFAKDILFSGGYAMMNHLAKTDYADEEQYVIDNFILNPYIGVNFLKAAKNHELKLKLGPLLSLERHRGVTDWKYPVGLWMDVDWEWKILGVRNTLYWGSKLFPAYEAFGNELYLGEAFFSSKFYDRLDILGRLYSNKYMELEAQLNFNFSSEGFIFYQRLLLNVNIGNLQGGKRKRSIDINN